MCVSGYVVLAGYEAVRVSLSGVDVPYNNIRRRRRFAQSLILTCVNVFTHPPFFEFFGAHLCPSPDEILSLDPFDLLSLVVLVSPLVQSSIQSLLWLSRLGSSLPLECISFFLGRL